MRKQLLTILTLCLLIPSAAYAEAQINVNLITGMKVMVNDMDTAGLHETKGLTFDIKREDWPVSINVDYQMTEGDDLFELITQVEAETQELNIGMKKIFRDREGTIFHPFLGAGLSMITADVETSNSIFHTASSESGTGYGHYLEAGMYWTIAQTINLGYYYKYTSADVELGDRTVDAGGAHFGYMLGYHHDF